MNRNVSLSVDLDTTGYIGHHNFDRAEQAERHLAAFLAANGLFYSTTSWLDEEDESDGRRKGGRLFTSEDETEPDSCVGSWMIFDYPATTGTPRSPR